MVYVAFHDEIASIRPFIKFCCIKAVVFATFWQSVIIAGLCYISIVPSTQTYSQEDVATGVQNFAITIEMALASFLHIWAFPPGEFAVGSPGYYAIGACTTTNKTPTEVQVVFNNEKPPALAVGDTLDSNMPSAEPFIETPATPSASVEPDAAKSNDGD